MWWRPEAAAVMMARRQQVQHPHPLLATTRAMANRIRIIGRHRYSIGGILAKCTHAVVEPYEFSKRSEVMH